MGRGLGELDFHRSDCRPCGFLGGGGAHSSRSTASLAYRSGAKLARAHRRRASPSRRAATAVRQLREHRGQRRYGLVPGRRPGQPIQVGAERAAMRRPDHRGAGHLRLKQHQAEPFPAPAPARSGAGGQHEQTGAGQLGGEFSVSKPRANPAPWVGGNVGDQFGRRLAAAADGQPDIRPAQRGDRRRQLRQTLVPPVAEPERRRELKADSRVGCLAAAASPAATSSLNQALDSPGGRMAAWPAKSSNDPAVKLLTATIRTSRWRISHLSTHRAGSAGERHTSLP